PQYSHIPWEKIYSRNISMTDVLSLVLGVFISQIIFIPSGVQLELFEIQPGLTISYTFLSVSLVIVWLIFLRLFATKNVRILGVGNAEYTRIFQSSLTLFSVLAITGYLTKTEISRSYVVSLFISGLVLLVVSRWLWRKWLTSQRKKDKLTDRAFLVGSPSSIREINSAFRAHPESGLAVAGTMQLEEGGNSSANQESIQSRVGSVIAALEASEATHLVICSSDSLSPIVVQELSWQLDPVKHQLIVAPSIIGVGGPRIHSRPVAGLPLLHIETPDFDGDGPASKRVLDIIIAGMLLLVLSPIFLVIALSVKLTSTGPVFYKQERVGLDGNTFNMLKFRSMKVNADAELAELLKKEGKGNTPFFKVDNDPRITPIGGFLRKYSLDEFPQLLNVLFGSMSLVGPRPQRPAEVELYDHVAARRLLVKPGMTGLWQVSGRSSLTWEESIRLDLYYVENWSLSADFLILARTAKAVLKPGDTAI
ncbi:MAG: sugar transferase, partial [Aurantimicrobium sp.]|uniref:sugar transferase n=2 Tax=Aurantimicrobium sp. TaxID=1930784 RepID=UPI0032200391